MKEPAAKKAKLDNQNDHLSKLPNELIKSIFRLFKPRELANVKQAAHRYNNLGVQVEEEAKAILLARFDNEAISIKKELQAIEYEGINYESFNYSIEDGPDGNELDNMINKTRNLITTRSYMDRDLCLEKITSNFHRSLISTYLCHVADLELNSDIGPEFMQKEFLVNAIGYAEEIREYLDILYPVVDKLVKLTLTYHEDYCSSILQRPSGSFKA